MVHPLEAALALFKQEKYEEAIIRSEKVALHEPNNANAFMIIGKSNFALEKWEECEQAFLRVTELKPDFPAVWRALSDLYNSQEKWTKGVDSLKALCAILKSSEKINAAQKRTLELAQTALKAQRLATAFDAFYSLVSREDKGFSLVHVPNQDILSPIQIWLQVVELLQHPTFNFDRCERDSLTKEAIAGEFLRDVGQYGRWNYDPKRLQVTEKSLSDSEIQQTADSITFCLNILIKHLKRVDRTDKMNRTELDALVRGVLEWFPVATLALEYILYRTEDEDADLNWNDTSDLACRLASIDSDSPFSLMAQALHQSKESNLSIARQTLLSAIRQNSSRLLGPSLRMCTSLAWIYVEEQNSDQILAILREIPSIISKKLESFGVRPHPSMYSDTIKDFLTAKAFAFAGTTDAALTLYEKVAEEGIGNLAISAAVCVSEFHLHRNPNKALEAVDRMVLASANASPSSQALLHCQRAWCRTFMDQNDVARLELERHVPLLEKKDQALALRRLGIVYWNLGGDYRVNKVYSLTCFLQAARLKSDDEAFAYIGKWYLEVAKDIVRSEKCFLRALELSPRNEMAGQALSALYTSTERQHLNVPLWEALTKEREIAPVWALLRLAQYYANQDDERAVETMLLALGNAPENAIHYVSLGHLYQHFGKYVSAQKTYLRAMELGADAWCLRCEIARLEAMFQLYDDALSRLEPLLARTLPQSVLAQTPEQHSIVSLHLADILYGQSKAFRAQGRYGDAVSNLKRASKVLRDSPETHVTRIPILRLLAEIHASAFHLSPKAFDMETGRADAWIAFIAQAHHTCDSMLKLLEASGKHTNTQMVDMYLLIATGCWYEAAALCCSLGMPIQALDPSPARCESSEIASKAAELQLRSCNYFVKALEIDPKNAFAWNGIGIVHGNAIVKQFCWIRAIQIAFLDAAWSNLGFFYVNAQQTFLAKEAFLKLQDVNPDHVGMWLGYGFLHRLEQSDSEAQLSIQAFACALSLEFDLDASLGLAFSLIDRADDLEIDNGLGLRLAEVVFYLHKYIERDPFSAIAWNTLGVALYHSELYQQSVEAFDTARNVLSSDSHSEWIRQIDGNRLAAALLAGKRMEQTVQLFEIVKLANTHPEKALERLKEMRSLFSNANYLGIATVLVLALAGREDQALGGLEGLLKAAENGGISSRACRNLLGITGLSVVLDQILAFGGLAVQIGRQSKRQIAFWTEKATALYEAFEASAYVFERGALAWTDLPSNTRTSALIALTAFHQNHVDAFDIAKRLRLEHTLPERYVAALLALLSSDTNESPSASLKLLRQDPTNASAYLYTAYALVQKGEHSSLERLVAQGRSYAKTAEMAFEFDILQQLITSKSSAVEIDDTGKEWQQIRFMAFTQPERAIDMYHAQCERTRDPRQQATLLIELASAFESARRVNAAISIWKWLLQRAAGLNVVDPESLCAACNLRLAFLYGVRLRKPKVAKGYLKAAQDVIPTHLIDAIQRMSG